MHPKHPDTVTSPSIPPEESLLQLENHLRRKIDLRLCTIAGLLCSLNLVDSAILSSASVTSMISDLNLHGTRYSVSIFIFTLASVAFQLPSTLAVRWLGPRLWFTTITLCFGVITLCTAFVSTWQQMIALRVLLGIAAAGIFPGLTYLISTWYPRREQQLRYAFLQSGQAVVLATGSIVNFALNHLDGYAGLQGWRWMYLVQGLITCVIGAITYCWMVDFPEKTTSSRPFLSEREVQLAVQRIQLDRGDVCPDPFAWHKVLANFSDVKIYGFACLGFIVNVVATALAYFLPIILQDGMGFSSNESILLATPPYYWSVIPALFTSFIGDTYRIRGPLLVFNALCLIAGVLMLGLVPSGQVAARYAGSFLATGAYIANWAALNAFVANNIVGQWKRATTTAVVAIFQGLGGVAGSFIVRQNEAPGYETAVWVIVALHVVMIIVVLVFEVGFYIRNRQQGAGRRVIQNTEGFRYTY
ncbi:hypothetical protein FE257_007751 [Aspergillus nanangensis]|uniref:Major facilitator superfamily (MFS) profile domain-containing protein n=1 Tax=Aspergillus nanangensis TaxID=2582783 RepID=A0AAD4CWZ0_ASPNN|nr:hypothetical protein FE257_007751 [Aspergillus nanangensis]